MTGWPNTCVKVARDMATVQSLVLVFLSHAVKGTSEGMAAVMAVDKKYFSIAFGLFGWCVAVRARSKVVVFMGVSISFCPFTLFLRRSPEKVTGKVGKVEALAPEM